MSPVLLKKKQMKSCRVFPRLEIRNVMKNVFFWIDDPLRFAEVSDWGNSIDNR